MSLLNKNISLDQRVVLTKLSPDLNGRTGSILGCSVSGLVDFYIVLLDTPLTTHKAVHVPEGCIEPLGWDSDGGRPINPDVPAAAACADGPRMPHDTRSPGDPTSTTPDDQELARIERDALSRELRRLRAMERWLQDWADQLESSPYSTCDVITLEGIAAILRRRMNGK